MSLCVYARLSPDSLQKTSASVVPVVSSSKSSCKYKNISCGFTDISQVVSALDPPYSQWSADLAASVCNFLEDNVDSQVVCNLTLWTNIEGNLAFWPALLDLINVNFVGDKDPCNVACDYSLRRLPLTWH